MEIRLLADHRDDLVAERMRIVNRLRWHLVDLCPQLEAQVPARCLDHPVWLEKVARKLQRLPASQARVRIARQLATSIRQLTREANDIEAQLRAMVRALSPSSARRVRLRDIDGRDADRPHRRCRAL